MLKDLLLNKIFNEYQSSNIAFCVHEEQVTYKQFSNIVLKIISVLESNPDKLIGLYVTDEVETYSSIIALWCVGKGYVPLSPNQPIERHREIIESIGLKYILTTDPLYNAGIVDLDYINTTDEIDSDYELNIADVSDDEIAYVLFTSGSTGKPKGVQITRGNVAALIDSMNKIGLDIMSEDRCLQPFDLTFDFSVSSYVIPLAKGASIYTIPNKAVKFTYIAQLLDEHHLTVLQMVPSMIRNLLPYLNEVDLSSVRYNILCGEALTGKVIKGWHQANPRMISYNMYGPTEDTVFCTYYKVDKSNISNLLAVNDIISIGKNLDNCGQLIVDDYDNIISEPNQVGELCLYGDQLSPGYWQNDKENSDKFFNINGERFYRTGDLCHFTEDGNIMFVGRKDFQVKINGYRVELGEIENKYSTMSKGKFCVVMPFVNPQGNTDLVIVIEGREYDYTEHKTLLTQLLPAYKVPNKWLFIKTIPLNQNGKVDRNEIKKIFNL